MIEYTHAKVTSPDGFYDGGSDAMFEEDIRRARNILLAEIQAAQREGREPETIRISGRTWVWRPLRKKIGDQPPPEHNTSTPIVDLVVADMWERKRIGTERYGTPLQAHNGRDALVDAYQEALDLVMYLRQAIEERDQGISTT